MNNAERSSAWEGHRNAAFPYLFPFHQPVLTHRTESANKLCYTTHLFHGNVLCASLGGVKSFRRAYMAAGTQIRMVLCVPVHWAQLSAGIKPSTGCSTAMDPALGFPPQHSPESWTQSQGTELRWLCLLCRLLWPAQGWFCCELLSSPEPLLPAQSPQVSALL